MGRNKDEAPACRVYTVCDESRYLTVRNVPALACSDELMKLFAQYGEIQECSKPMDAEDCEPYTDVYWIRFHMSAMPGKGILFHICFVVLGGTLHVHLVRFAKLKLDEAVSLGNHIQVSYAPNFESLSDTKEKLEGRRKEIRSHISLELGMVKNCSLSTLGLLFWGTITGKLVTDDTVKTNEQCICRKEQQKKRYLYH